MLSIRRFLGLDRTREAAPPSDTDTVRRIVRELEALPPEQARYVAAFAFVLNRVARADLEISEVETARMETIVRDYGNLSEAQAVLVVEIARTQANLLAATEDYLVTREFMKLATPEQRQQLLYCLFEVSAADDSISVAEEELIRQISHELEFTHADYIAARSAYSAKRAVLRGLPG
jgi:uncharacterized tellurite resistance protein B-like protein